MLSCINLVYQLSEMQTHEIKYWIIIASTLVISYISLGSHDQNMKSCGCCKTIVMDNYKTFGLNLAAKFLITLYNFYEYTDIHT